MNPEPVTFTAMQKRAERGAEAAENEAAAPSI